ncbi:MAG: iron-sulfur cluster assembly accessory protein [Paracoccaceae bacterium]
MFGIPGKQAVTLTPKAVAQVLKLMEGKAHVGLRLGVKKGGCAGMEYTMEFVDQIDNHDEVIEQDGARVMIAPMAQMFLFGTEIDYESSLLESGFKFNNPNVTEACGCGESIKFAGM